MPTPNANEPVAETLTPEARPIPETAEPPSPSSEQGSVTLQSDQPAEPRDVSAAACSASRPGG